MKSGHLSIPLLAQAYVETVRESIQKEIESLGIDRFAFYTLPIPRALTYLGG